MQQKITGMKLSSIILLIILTNSIELIAQRQNVGQIKEDGVVYKEVEITNSFVDYYSISLGKDGVLLYNEGEATKSSFRGDRTLILTKMNANLNEEYTVNFIMKGSNSYRQSKVKGNYVYLLFSSEENDYLNPVFPNPNFITYEIVRFNYSTKEIKQFKDKIKGTFHLSQLEITDSLVTLIGKTGITKANYEGSVFFYKEDFKPCIIQVDISKNTKVVYQIDSFPSGINEILGFDHNKIANEMSFIVKYKSKKGTGAMMSSIHPKMGTKNIPLELPENIEICNSVVNNVDRNYTIAAGTYGPLRYLKSEDPSLTSGIYITLLKNEKPLLKWIPWKQFTSIKQGKGLTVSTVDLNPRGSFEVSTANLLFHKAIVKDKEIVFVAEIYYPKYEKKSISSWDPIKSTYNSVIANVFTGYVFSDVFMFALNNEGELLWDNIVATESLFSSTFTHRFKLYETQDGYEFLHNYLTEMNKVSVDTLGNFIGKSKFEIKSYLPKDYEVKYYTVNTNKIDHLVDDYFIACSRLELKEKEGKKKKEIFYLYKGRFPDPK